MTLASTSDLSMVAAAVIYAVAMVLHALEWSAARNLQGVRPASGSEDSDRIRVDGFSRMGVALTVVGALVHSVGVVTRGLAANRPPWGNMYEFSTAALLLVAIAYLVLVFGWGLRSFGLFITLLLTIIQGLSVTVFWVKVAPLVPALHSVWFIVHIIMAIMAGVGFNIGGIASILYLLRVRAGKKSQQVGEPVRGYIARFKEGNLDLLSYRMAAFAFPVWTFTVAAGSIWAEYAWGRYWGWDPKETWSLVTWVVYAGYLHARATAGWRGVRAAWISVLGMASFWFNFIGVNLLMAGLHSYSGL